MAVEFIDKCDENGHLKHPTHGYVDIRPCSECGSPYPEWTVKSTMMCPQCRCFHRNKTLTDELETLRMQYLRMALKVGLLKGDVGGDS